MTATPTPEAGRSHSELGAHGGMDIGVEEQVDWILHLSSNHISHACPFWHSKGIFVFILLSQQQGRHRQQLPWLGGVDEHGLGREFRLTARIWDQSLSSRHPEAVMHNGIFGCVLAFLGTWDSVGT